MIRNDLKELLPENWRSIFSHRFCDPENYEVGVFTIEEKEKILVLNPDTLDIMEYFFDDKPDDYWIDLEFFFKLEKEKFKKNTNKFFISKNYLLKVITDNRIYSPRNLNLIKQKENSYPRVCFSFSKNGSKNSKSIFIHRVIAYMFVPNLNPDNYNIVNHKDNNPCHFYKENLEWCDIKYNNSSKNKIITKTPGDNYIYYQINEKGETVKIFNGRKEIIEQFPRYSSYLDNGKYINGFTFKREERTALSYIQKHPIIEGGWFVNKSITTKKVEANLCGVLRIDGKLTVGSRNRSNNYYEITISKQKYSLHRLIYETISGKSIPSDKVIDHIIPVTEEDTNNEFINLKLCTQQENMNNSNTRRKMLVYYNKYDVFGNFIETVVGKGKLTNYISDGIKKTRLTSKGFMWCRSGEDDIINKKLRYMWYRFDEFGNLEAGGNCFSKISKKNSKKIELSKYANTGMLDPKDKCYYQQGFPDKLFIDPTNISLKRLIPILKWEGIKEED